MRDKITAIIPTFNEEVNIEGALDSLIFADEVIVIDSFSKDKTIDFCEQRNVRILQRVFDDFSSQKNFAIEQASYDWIFILDADERVSSALSNEIIEAVKEPKGVHAFQIFRTFYYKDQKIKYGGWQTDKVIRLFKKNGCRYDGKLVHEKIITSGKVDFMHNRLDHYSFKNKEQYVKKLSFYASLQAKELIEKGVNVNIFHIIIKPIFRFFVQYVIRFGFLDGDAGFMLAKLHAAGVRLRYQQYKFYKKRR